MAIDPAVMEFGNSAAKDQVKFFQAKTERYTLSIRKASTSKNYIVIGNIFLKIKKLEKISLSIL